jgi:metal-responsive CopG/Arc/MetJ family transcriptional regulator
MKIEIDIPEGLLHEIDNISKLYYHTREEYILEKYKKDNETYGEELVRLLNED